MQILSNRDLSEIKGGAIKWGLAIVGAGIVSFLAGVIDGLMNPIKCHK